MVTSRVSVTGAAIATGLRQLGVAAGSRIAVHSSLSAFGHVVGGAEAVVAALREVVTGEGTIVMPAYLLGPPAPL
ncbi:MAG: AAC(3) family N-acetyltransferase, partial [Candidatus Latescibacterota bacterium]